jgi:hypothetical protein
MCGVEMRSAHEIMVEKPWRLNHSIGDRMISKWNLPGIWWNGLYLAGLG